MRIDTSWPVTLLFAIAVFAMTGMLAVVIEHLRPHREDVRQIEARVSSMGLRACAISRTRASWRLHYRKSAWPLSRFSRFYRIEARTNEGESRNMLAAIDPWHARLGAQIL